MVSLWKRHSASPAWGPVHHWKLVRRLPIFSVSFTSSSRKWLSRKSQRWGSAWADPKRAWFSFFSMRMQLPQCPGFYPTQLEMASVHPGKRCSRCPVVFPFQERLSTLILLGQFPETVAHALQSYAVVVEIEAQCGRCKRLANAR